MTEPPLRSPEDAPRDLPSAPAPEAAPAPPTSPSRRALRTMAIVRWALLLLVGAVALSVVWTHWGPAGDASHQTHALARFYCPMHPQIRSPEPGECPICHMDLEPIPEERQSSGATPPLAPASATHAALPEVATVHLSEEKQRAVGLAVAPVESAALGDRLRVPGVLGAPETGVSQVRVRAPGFVEKVAVRQTGVRVSRGQVLAYVYSPEIYRAQEEYLAATRWSTAGSAATPGRAAAGEIAAAARRGLELLGLETAEIEEIGRTGQPLRAIPLRAPAAGYVTRFNAILGSRADPEMVLYEISDLSKLWVIASLHEREVAGLGRGTPARFTPSGSSTPLSAKIELIEPLLEESTRTTRVRLSVDNRDGRLRPGQYGEVELELSPTAGLFVPSDAVIRTGQHEYVYVATSNDDFTPRRVRTGLSREGRVQVVEGLSAGERVVTRGSFMLDSESRLQASLAAVPAAPPAGGAPPVSSPAPSPAAPGSAGHAHPPGR